MAPTALGAHVQLTKAQKIAFFVFIVSFGLLSFRWVDTAQKELQAELRRIASSELDYLILCEFRGNPKPQPCQTIDRTRNEHFATAIRYLSQATPASHPSKTSPTSDKILKLGRGSPASKEYLACYRATTYSGFNQIYISAIGTDRDCSWPNKYHAGSVAIPAQAFGQGAI